MTWNPDSIPLKEMNTQNGLNGGEVTRWGVGALGGQTGSLGAGAGGRVGRRRVAGSWSSPCPLRPVPRSGAWLQPGLTFQVSLAGDQSAEATNTAQNSEAWRPPPQCPSPSASPHPRPSPCPVGPALGAAPIRPSLTRAAGRAPPHREKVFLAIIKVIKPPKAPVGCWF